LPIRRALTAAGGGRFVALTDPGRIPKHLGVYAAPVEATVAEL